MTASRPPSPPSSPPEPARLRQIAAAIERRFPLVSRPPGLVLFDVEPGLLQAQWQLEPQHLKRARAAFPAAKRPEVRLQLRLWLLEASGQSRQILCQSPSEAEETEGVARLAVGREGAGYQAELGLASGDGGWMLMMRSNRLQLVPPPPRLPSPPPARTVPARPRRTRPVPLAPPAGPTVGRPVAFDPTLGDSGLRLPPVFPHPRRSAAWSPRQPFARMPEGLQPPTPGGAAIPLPVSAHPGPGTPVSASPSRRRPGDSEKPSGENARPAAVLPVFPPFLPETGCSSFSDQEAG